MTVRVRQVVRVADFLCGSSFREQFVAAPFVSKTYFAPALSPLVLVERRQRGEHARHFLRPHVVERRLLLSDPALDVTLDIVDRPLLG